MLHRFAPILIIIVALLYSPANAQEEAVQLAPATDWNLHYADDSCVLGRIFGEEGQQVFLSLRQYGPSSELETTIVSNDLRRRSHFRRLAITFAPDSEALDDLQPQEVSMGEFGEGVMFTTSLKTARQQVLANELWNEQQIALALSDEQRDARETEIDGIEIAGLFTRPVSLDTGPLHPAMAAMRTCIDELLTHWGIDVEAHRSLLRPVRPLEMERWSRELIQRYPEHLFRRGEQANVRIRLSVSIEGRATDCAVQAQLNDEAFDELACELLVEHARFEPALDGNGDPIASYWQTAVVYTIQ